jgi:signal transduction histidine kinase
MYCYRHAVDSLNRSIMEAHLEDTLAVSSLGAMHSREWMYRVMRLLEATAGQLHDLKHPAQGTLLEATALLRQQIYPPPVGEDPDSLRSFYKTGTPTERQLIDLKEIIEQMSGLLKGEADRHTITIYSEVETNTPNILVNPVQLQQIFMNLMLNALEAMKDIGGTLTIRSRINLDNSLFVSISDTGIGLPTGSTEQVFEPFHTTKPQGTGMGLTITRSIVESYGGRVWATANRDRGATFHFTLPCASEAPV